MCQDGGGPCTFRPINFAEIEKWKIAFPLQLSASVKMGNRPDVSFEGRRLSLSFRRNERLSST